MINDWRRAWVNGTAGIMTPDFPFGFVQVRERIGDIYHVTSFSLYFNCDFDKDLNKFINIPFLQIAYA